MRDAGIQSIKVLIRRDDGLFAGDDCVVVEEPLEIRVNDVSLAVTMRTPGDDEALAVGFLATEGILSGPTDLFDVTRCGDSEADPDALNIVTAYVAPERVKADVLTGRQRYATSACGLCGKATLDSIRTIAPKINSIVGLKPEVLATLPDRLRHAQQVFSRTGGLHAAGVFDVNGELLFSAEDIGRHNAVDKAIGKALLADRWPLDNTILMVSGRAGFEIVQKALMARIPAVASVSAPSSLAVAVAREHNMTLIGFLRGSSFNVYAGPNLAPV